MVGMSEIMSDLQIEHGMVLSTNANISILRTQLVKAEHVLSAEVADKEAAIERAERAEAEAQALREQVARWQKALWEMHALHHGTAFGTCQKNHCYELRKSLASQPSPAAGRAEAERADRERWAKFAQDAIDLFLEYRDGHEYDESTARATAILEAAEGAPSEALDAATRVPESPASES